MKKTMCLWLVLMVVILGAIFYMSLSNENVYAATGKFVIPPTDTATPVPPTATPIPPTPTPVPPSTGHKVFLSGSRYYSGFSVGDYMKYYTMTFSGEGGDSSFLSNQGATASQIADWNAFESKLFSWPPSAQVFGTGQDAPQTNIVDENGNIIGTLDTNSLFDTGLPGMRDLGNPWGNGDYNRVWVGPGSLTYGGVTYDVVGFVSVSPIIIDIYNNDKPDVDKNDWQPHPARFNISRAKMFDITGTGQPNLVEWVGPKSGLLVAPIDEVKVVGGRQLFGTAVGFVDGYQKLALLRDKNADGVISGKELEGLKVWVDKNQDGVCTPDELTTVQELGITSLDCKHKDFASHCIMKGKSCKTWDWWPTMMVLRPTASR